MANEKSKGNKGLSSAEILSFSASIEAMSKQTGIAQEKIEKMLASGKKLSKQLKEAADKRYKELNKEVKSLDKNLESLNKRQLAGEKGLDRQIRSATKLRSQYAGQISTLDKLGTASEGSAGAMSKMNMAMIAAGAAVAVLSVAIDGVIKLFKNWEALETKWAETMGTAAMATGASEKQFKDLRKGIEQTRDTFSKLEGSVDGIQLTGQELTQLATSYRDLSVVTDKKFNNSMIFASRVMGLGMDSAAKLRLSLEGLGVTKTSEDFDNFNLKMIDFAESLGTSSAVVMKEFEAARNGVAQFGKDGVKEFQKVSLFAKKFGIEANKIFDAMQKFDTFGGASDSVNQLNAALGTTISSYELMMTDSPADRMEMLRQGLKNQGKEWDNLGRIEKRILAEAAGLEEDAAARVFRDGETLEQMKTKQLAEAKKIEDAKNKEISNQERMNELLMQTSKVFNSMDRQLEKIMNMFSESLGPLFKLFNEYAVGFLEEVGKAIKEFSKTKEFKELLGTIGEAMVLIGGQLKEIAPTAAKVISLLTKVATFFLKTRIAMNELNEPFERVFKQGLGQAFDTVSKLYDKFVAFFSETSKGTNALGASFGMYFGMVEGLWDSVINLGKEWLEWGAKMRGLLFDFITSPFIKAFEYLKPKLETFFSPIISIIEKVYKIMSLGAKGVATGVTESLMGKGSSSAWSLEQRIANNKETERRKAAITPANQASTSATQTSPVVQKSVASGNEALNKTSSKEEIRIVASDVYLDSKKIGQANFEIAMAR